MRASGIHTIFRVVDECAVHTQRHLTFIPMFGQLFPWYLIFSVWSVAEKYWPCQLLGAVKARWHMDAHATRRKSSLTRPWMLVARCTSAPRSRSLHAALIRAAFSFSAAERTGVAALRRRVGRLVELTEREGARDGGRDGAISRAAPASRVGTRLIEVVGAARSCSGLGCPVSGGAAGAVHMFAAVTWPWARRVCFETLAGSRCL